MSESSAMGPEELRERWQQNLGADPGDGWTTLSGGATYRAPDEASGTLSGQATMGATLSGSGTVSGADAGSATSRIGLGGFQLVEEIGRGGMGVVWRARQQSLAREVAIKLIKPEADNERARRGFVAEALVNGVLDHPNIVPVHELGTNAQGEAFLAMKLVGGTSWDRLLHPQTAAERQRAAGYDLDRHLAVLESVANAIAFAHSRGIVHRDLKPENVMVGDYGEVLVMDWGIAVDIRDQPDPNDARATHKSAVRSPSGTPSYMPPELAEGRGTDIGPWTDVYLLGAILCELLRGTPPHQGKSLMAILLAASASVPPAFASDCPAGLVAICHRALARDHRARYPHVPAFQAALAEYRSHRESEIVATAAQTALDRCAGRDAAALDGPTRAALYGDFAEAVAGFRQARVLWRDNQPAASGERQARAAYATAALAAGDLALAEAQAAPLDDAELKGRIAQTRATRLAQENAAKRNRKLLVAAALLIIGGLGVGVLLVTGEQRKTAEQRDLAITAEQHARSAEADAERQRDAALTAQREATSLLSGRLYDAAMTQIASGNSHAARQDLWQASTLERDADGRPGPRSLRAWAAYQMSAAATVAQTPARRLAPPPPWEGFDPANEGSPSVNGWRLAATTLLADGDLLAVWLPNRFRSNAISHVQRIGADGALRLQYTATLPPGVERIVVSGDTVVVAMPHGMLGLALDDGRVRWQRELTASDPKNRFRPGPGTRNLRVLPDGRIAAGHGTLWLELDVRTGDTLACRIMGHGGFPAPHGDWVLQLDLEPNAMFAEAATLIHPAPPRARTGTTKVQIPLPLGHGERVLHIEADPTGESLFAIVAQGGNRRLIQYDTMDGKVRAVLIENLPTDSRIASVGNDGSSILIAEPLGQIIAVTVPPSPGMRLMPGIAGDVVDLHADGDRVLIRDPAGTLRLTSLTGGHEHWRSALHAGEQCGGFSVDGGAVVIASANGVRLLKSADGQALGAPIPALFNTSEAVSSWPHGRTVSLSADHQQVMIVWGDNRLIDLFTVATGTPIAEFSENWGGAASNMAQMFHRQHVVGDLRIVSHQHETETYGSTFGWNEVFQSDFKPISGLIMAKADERLAGPFVHALAGSEDISVVEAANRVALIALAGTQPPILLPVQASRLISVDADTGLILTTGANSLDVWELPGGRLVARLPAQPDALDGQHPWNVSPWQHVTGPWRWHRSDQTITLRRRHGTQIQEWALLRALPGAQEPAPPVVAWGDAGRAWAPASAATAQPAWTALQQAEAIAALRAAPQLHLPAVERAAIAATAAERQALLSGDLARALRDLRPDRPVESAVVPPSTFTVSGTVNNQPQATNGQRKLLWVPPGSYRVGEAEYHRHPHSGEFTEIPNANFTLVRGFWIDADLWTEGQIDYKDWQTVMGKRPYAPLIHGSRSAVKVYRALSAEQAADFHDNATSWRLPTAAQIRAALQVHGPTLRSRLIASFWLADGWLPTSVDTAAIDPRGSWDSCVWQITDTDVAFQTRRGDGFDGLHLFNAVGVRRIEAGQTTHIRGIQTSVHRAISSMKHRYLSQVLNQVEYQAALLLVHP